jgi:hypothetical protein
MPNPTKLHAEFAWAYNHRVWGCCIRSKKKYNIPSVHLSRENSPMRGTLSLRLGTLKSKVAWLRQPFRPASSAFPSHSPDNVRDLKSQPRCFGGHPSKGATSGNGCGGGLLEALGMPDLWFARISMHSDEDKRVFSKGYFEVSLRTTTAC